MSPQYELLSPALLSSVNWCGISTVDAVSDVNPHTRSYYAATVGPLPDYAPLRGDADTDVCVIGAGFTGLSTAICLAERGYRVRVLEANRVGWGASGRNGGQIIGGFAGERVVTRHLGDRADEIVWPLRWVGHDIIRQRVATYGIDCDLKWGYADAATRPRHLRDLKLACERLQRHNFAHEFRLNSASETRDLLGTDAYCGSLLNMGNGHVHPLKLCVGEAAAAASLGVTIHEQSPVLTIDTGTRPRVVTRDGSITADSVVLAGNAYHDVNRKLRGYLFPVNSFIVATEPLPAHIAATINPRDVAVCDSNFVLEYYRLSADKRLLFGGRLPYSGDDEVEIRRRMRKKMLALYPMLAPYRLDYAWTGKIGVTVNRVPQFGHLAPNVYYCQGFSGHGVNMSHAAGDILAEAIAGTMERFDVFAGIRPVRVPGAYRLQSALIALGILYYRLRDRL
ncbi:MAG: FAD-binding oxidoreductase [Woeseia sp.]